MKAEHRHELKTNELAEWVANLPQWTKENLRMIIAVLVVIAVAAGLYYWQIYSKRTASVRDQLRFTSLITQLSQGKKDILEAQSRGVDTSYMLLQLANNLKNFARNAKNEQSAALALIKGAEALRAELHYRSGTVDKQDLTNQISKAKDSYSEALEKSTSNPSLMAMAKFGLGLCEEELGNFDQARQIYGDLAANPDLQSTPAAAQAKQRLEMMADYRRKVVFNPPRGGPKPAPAGPVQPQIQLGPVDIDLADTSLNDMNLAGP